MSKPQDSPHNSPHIASVPSQQQTLYVRESYRQSAGFTEFMSAMSANAIDANIISLADSPEDTMSMAPQAKQVPESIGVKAGMFLAIIIIGLLVVRSF